METINEFFQDMQDIMNKVVEKIDWLSPEREDIHGSLRKAWNDLPLRDLQDKVRNFSGDRNKLREYGLEGYNWELKLREYNWRKQAYNSIKDKIEDKSGFWPLRHLIKKIILKLLNAIDNILDTLSVAVPGIQALKELKDTLCSILDE